MHVGTVWLLTLQYVKLYTSYRESSAVGTTAAAATVAAAAAALLSAPSSLTYLGDEIKSSFHAVPLFFEYFHNIGETRVFSVRAHNSGYCATALQLFFR